MGGLAMNSTMDKFGYPDSLVREFDHWVVLLRPAQVTLGSLVLAAKSGAIGFGALPPAAFAELSVVVPAVEAALSAVARYERINYLMLMMVDPHVHFHVIPRYSETRQWRGHAFADAGWPGVPDLKTVVTLGSSAFAELKNEIKTCL